MTIDPTLRGLRQFSKFLEYDYLHQHNHDNRPDFKGIETVDTFIQHKPPILFIIMTIDPTLRGLRQNTDVRINFKHVLLIMTIDPTLRGLRQENLNWQNIICIH